MRKSIQGQTKDGTSWKLSNAADVRSGTSRVELSTTSIHSPVKPLDSSSCCVSSQKKEPVGPEGRAQLVWTALVAIMVGWVTWHSQSLPLPDSVGGSRSTAAFFGDAESESKKIEID